MNTQYGESHTATSWRHNLRKRSTETDPKLHKFSKIVERGVSEFGRQIWRDVRWEVARL